MCLHIRAHFDGHAFIPDQPVDFPLNKQLELEVREIPDPAHMAVPPADAADIQERLRKLKAFFGQPPIGDIPLESLRRENLYEDRA